MRDTYRNERGYRLRIMANEDYDFDDFESDVAEAAQAEAEAEEATPSAEEVEDVEESFEEDVEQKAPVKKTAVPSLIKRPQRVETKAPMALSPKRNPVAPQAPNRAIARPENAQRYVAVMLPKEYGIYDSDTKSYYKKDADANELLLAMAADIKNDLEEIKKSL